MQKRLSKDYIEWSIAAQKAQIDLNKKNKDLARECNLSRQYVTSITSGRREVPNVILRISEILGILPPRYLQQIKKAE